jgi:hypothetical protein
MGVSSSCGDTYYDKGVTPGTMRPDRLGVEIGQAAVSIAVP